MRAAAAPAPRSTPTGSSQRPARPSAAARRLDTGGTAGPPGSSDVTRSRLRRAQDPSSHLSAELSRVQGNAYWANSVLLGVDRTRRLAGASRTYDTRGKV